jgi:site-specific DNA-cytosine methylase
VGTNFHGKYRLFTQLYPTPTVRGNYNREGVSANSGDGLATFVKKLMYPTPTANDSKNNAPPSQHTENGRHSNSLNVVAGGALNPRWVEWLMGFPIDWTDIDAENFVEMTGHEHEWWDIEPDIPRVAKGIPNRVARLRALGNAVVPMQAYPIFAVIAEIGGVS